MSLVCRVGMELARTSLVQGPLHAACELRYCDGFPEVLVFGKFPFSIVFVVFVFFCFLKRPKGPLTTTAWECGGNNRPAALSQSRRGENVLRQLVESHTAEVPTTQRNVAVWELTHSHP